ncbi:MAG TPA: ABC transporter substrate-binding protein [Chloroflexia bacterium]|nr:ABC transporter substrate-binding protein [Chloroflexia bacterium]
MTRKTNFFSFTRLGLILSLLFIATLLLSACGDNASTVAPASSTVASAVTAVATTASAGSNTTAASKPLQGTLRLGFFPNLTHAQALVGIGNGTFARVLGSGVKLETKPFNAGPAAVEALLAGDIDMTYIGPNPAITAYTKTQGNGVRVIAGAASGGVSFVVRPDAGINSAKDLAGKKIASPQLGNTQDVALRAYIKQAGLETTEKGGNVQVVPTDNSNILQLFQNKQIDGAWVPEPWATRLVVEQKGKVLLDERSLWPDGKFVITHILVSNKYLKQNPEIVRAFLDAHIQVTQDIQRDPESAKKVINDQLKSLTGKALPDEILNQSFSKLDIVLDPLKSTLLKSADSAFDAGFLGKTKPQLDGLYDLTILNSLLQEKGLKTVNP